MDKYRIFDSTEFEEREHSEKLKTEAKEQLEQILLKVDFEKLHSIFGSLAKSTGLAEPNLLGKDSIFTEHDYDRHEKGWAGKYSAKENQIFIHLQNLNELPQEWKDFALFHTVVHENTHALSRKECNDFGVNYYDSGLSQMTENRFADFGRFSKLLINFDEAVTETIARDIFKKYIDSDPNREQYLKLLEDTWGLPYQEEVEFLAHFIDQLVSKTGVSREVVYEGIVSDYLKGVKLMGTDLEKELENIFYEGVVHEIGNMKDPQDINKILEKMEHGDTKSLVEKIRYKIKRKLTIT